MSAAFFKYFGCAAITGLVVVSGRVADGYEARAAIDRYELNEVQVTIMKFCKTDLDKTELTYELDVSDMAICGCIADKLTVHANFVQTLESGIDRYATHRYNPEVTGQYLSLQLMHSIDRGIVPADMRRYIVKFGHDYEAAAQTCIDDRLT